MQGDVLVLGAVEEQERVDEDGEVGDDGDVEGAVIGQHIGVNAEPVAEEDPGGVCVPRIDLGCLHLAEYPRPLTPTIGAARGRPPGAYVRHSRSRVWSSR